MTISKKRAEKCVTHYYGCDCREYRYQEMESALKVIHHGAYLLCANGPFNESLCDIVDTAKEALECLSKQP